MKGGWGRGDGGKKERAAGRRRLVEATESSHLTVVAAAAGDEPFGPTTDRGYGKRRRRRRRFMRRLAANGFAVAPDFFRYSNKLLQICKIVSMFWLFIEFFCFRWEFKNPSRFVVFCQLQLCIFHATLNIWFSFCWFTA